jgi:glutamate carboxypeptidase
MKISPALLATTLAAVASVPSANAAPTAIEQAMLSVVDRESERSVGLLEKIVNVNSGTMNAPGVKQVADLVAAEFAPLGFTTRWIPMTEAGRSGHLVAERRGKGNGKRLLLIAHLDTVFEPESGFLRFVRRGDTLEGPGTSDDKGGVIAIIAALRAMKEAKALDQATITVFMTGDEERAGEPIAIARGDLIKAADVADVALDFEPVSRTNGQEMGSVSRRGYFNWTLETTGVAGHSSGVFSDRVGYGAIYEMARILDAFRRELPERGLTYNSGLVVGGAEAALNDKETGGSASGKNNIMAAHALVRGDLRMLDEAQGNRARAKMEAIVAQHLPRTGATLTFNTGYPPMGATPGNMAVLASLNAVNRDLGLPEMPLLDPMLRGGGDISFVASRVDGIVGMGPGGGNGHSAGETVELPSLIRQSKRAALLMYRLSLEARVKGAKQ